MHFESHTRFRILWGNSASPVTLISSFSDTSAALNDSARLSDVYHLTGVDSTAYVLQLSLAGISGSSVLAYLDADGNWVNAVLGNSTGSANFVGDHAYDSSYFSVGNYGVDTANGTVWAVLDHNSDFAVIPEPSTWALLGLGAAVISSRLIRRRQTA